MADDDAATNQTPAPESGLYQQILDLCEKWSDLLLQLEKKEKDLHQEVLKAIDQEKMKNILQKIKK